MHLTFRDEEIVRLISTHQQVSIEAAAYAVYRELTNKKTITQREFHRTFKDNWKMFADLCNEEYDKGYDED